ncbi:hypothetical protein [Nocardia abscessus]|uniref:hypothetical protein n=1 Tax=Nocardia abscessus TaxID=120957 RepID=UPI002456092B|nr:hypothetical protein [Nocardia abscessus]
MGIAALITWLLTAGGGSVLLSTWIAKGGARQPTTSHLPPPVVFGHFLLAAAGLIVWIVYLVADSTALAWIAFALLVPVAALGFAMLLRWLPVYRTRTTAAADSTPPEQHFPVLIVAAHGVLALTTVILVLLTALGIG